MGLIEGALLFAKTIGITYGPHGRTVIMDRATGMLSTKDGVSVAREVYLEDKIPNMGAAILREACLKVNGECGDGTTSVAVVAGSLLKHAQKLVLAGADLNDLNKEIRSESARLIHLLDDVALDVHSQDLLERVIYLASNGDIEVATKLAEACMAVGDDGTVLVEDGHGTSIALEFREGIDSDKGTASPHFLTNGGDDRVFDKPIVAVVGERISKAEDVIAILEASTQFESSGLVVICEDVVGDALQTMLANNRQGIISCIAAQAPGFLDRRERIKDIAAITGALYVTSEEGYNLSAWDVDWFGTAEKITVGLKKTSIVAIPEAPQLVEDRVHTLQHELERCTSEYDRDKLRNRIATLVGGLCVMKVGGVTESAMRERRARIEDALGTVRSALKKGVLPGAGRTYQWLAHQTTCEPLRQALLAPLYTLANNAEQEGPSIDHRVSLQGEELWKGWDPISNEIRDLSAIPLVGDPLLVVKSVVATAVSVATTILTADVALTTT